MTPRVHGSRHAFESCMVQLQSWKPFTSHCSSSSSKKKPCLADRSTAVPPDLSLLSLFEDPQRQRWIGSSSVRKRRRVVSRSVSGRSSDRQRSIRSGSVGEMLTDSSGELFVAANGFCGGDNGSSCWGSDASEAKKDVVSGSICSIIGERNLLERESSGSGSVMMEPVQTLPQQQVLQQQHHQQQGVESGYGSEPGYRGDAELGYDDEFDEEEDEGRMPFWGGYLGDHMEVVGENNFSEQKMYHRGRRKKHDWRVIAP